MQFRRIAALSAAFLVPASLLWAHDLFLKLDTYFLEPNTRVRIPVLNGTFQKSEGWVAADRIADISLVAPDGRARLAAPSVWSRGPDSTSLLSLDLGAAGTYVAGVSVRPRELELSAKDFNAYLEEDGLPDVLEARRRDHELDRPAKERYSKHVKAVFQAGDPRTGGFAAVLGYPAEIVPLENPYRLGRAATLPVRCLVDGKPVANQVVLWGGEHRGTAVPQRSGRTDQDGVALIVTDSPGRWYVKFIHMAKGPQTGLDYESKWATLTFETR